MLEALATALTVRTMAVADKIPFLLAQAPPGGGAPGPAGGATGGGGAVGPGTGTGGGTGASPLSQFFPIIILGFLMFMVVSMIMSGKREKKARAELMSSLAKHDKVQTAGGMIGTIVEVKGEEVVLKVDESTNTKIRFARSSVTAILKKGRGADSPTEPETIDSVN